MGELEDVLAESGIMVSAYGGYPHPPIPYPYCTYDTGAPSRIRTKIMDIDKDEIRSMVEEIMGESSTRKGGNKGRQIHVWLPLELYDAARELVSTGAYDSLSSLVRQGVEREMDTNLGLVDRYKAEASAIDIGIGKRIDGTVVWVNKAQWDKGTDAQHREWMSTHGVYTTDEYNTMHNDSE